MGVLKREDSSSLIVLHAETTIGRSSHSTLVIADSLVSSLHASVRWRPNHWEARDLGSTNGTFVNGARLESGRARPLQVGDTICFGSRAVPYRMLDASQPALMATADDGEIIVAEGSVLTIPDGEPVVSVFRNASGEWLAEHADGAGPVHCGYHVIAGGKRWVVTLPNDVTTTNAAQEHDVRASSLLFEVSADEESVVLTVEHPSGRTVLGRRAFNYMLLTLARRRLDDARASLCDAECGWIHLDELSRSLRTEPEHINVDIFRFRRALGASFHNAADVIERRVGAGELRLGVREIGIRRSRSK